MSERDEVSSEDGAINLFEEPKDFYKPEPEATKAIHRLRDGREMSIRLVGHNPLWVGVIPCRLQVVLLTPSLPSV